MKSIIEREATLKTNSDMEVKVTQKKSSRAFAKETQPRKICSTVKSKTLAGVEQLLQHYPPPSYLPVQHD